MGTVTAGLDREIAAYDAMRASLENEHMGQWVVVREEQLVGLYPSFEDAARVAVERFGRGPYLIRKIGAAPVALPASVVYHLRHHA